MWPKIVRIGVPDLYIFNEIDYIITPYGLDATKEWYTKEFGEEVSDVKHILQEKWKEEGYWEQATKDEEHLIRSIPDCYEIKTNGKFGSIKNCAGDIYKYVSYEQGILPKGQLQEPEILCSTEI